MTQPEPYAALSTLTQAMRGAINTFWYLPKFGHDQRRIACAQITGDSLVARGLAEKYMEGKKVCYRLTEHGLKVAVILKRLREAGYDHLGRPKRNDNP